jgi:hypothetical protein
MSSFRLFNDGVCDLAEESDQLAPLAFGQALQHALRPGDPTPQRSLVERMAGWRERYPHHTAVVLRALPLNHLPTDEPIDNSGSRAEWQPNAPGKLTHSHRALCPEGVNYCDL